MVCDSWQYLRPDNQNSKKSVSIGAREAKLVMVLPRMSN